MPKDSVSPEETVWNIPSVDGPVVYALMCVVPISAMTSLISVLRVSPAVIQPAMSLVLTLLKVSDPEYTPEIWLEARVALVQLSSAKAPSWMPFTETGAAPEKKWSQETYNLQKQQQETYTCYSTLVIYLNKQCNSFFIRFGLLTNGFIQPKNNCFKKNAWA